MENKQLEDFAQRVKKLSEDELKGYMAAANNINRILSLLGVSFIFLMLSYPLIPVITIGGFMVYVFGKTSEGVSKSLALVREQLLKFQKS
jgi:membrane-bound ClpP family serine protease